MHPLRGYPASLARDDKGFHPATSSSLSVLPNPACEDGAVRAQLQRCCPRAGLWEDQQALGLHPKRLTGTEERQPELTIVPLGDQVGDRIVAPQRRRQAGVEHAGGI